MNKAKTSIFSSSLSSQTQGTHPDDPNKKIKKQLRNHVSLQKL